MSGEMTVGELMGMLEDEPEDATVRIVHQRSHPLQELIGGIASSGDLLDEDFGFPTDPDSDEPATVYLVANGHPEEGKPYGSRDAWNVMRRGRR